MSRSAASLLRILAKPANAKPRARGAANVRAQSEHEATFELQLRADRLPAYNREWAFCERKWRFDFAWPVAKVAVEIEGGIHTNGRHNRGSGFESDCRKYLRATVLGWTVIRATPAMVKSGELLEAVKEVLQARSGTAGDNATIYLGPKDRAALQHELNELANERLQMLLRAGAGPA